MNKSQLIEDLISLRPDLKRSLLESFSLETLTNIMTVESKRVANEAAEMAIESLA